MVVIGEDEKKKIQIENLVDLFLELLRINFEIELNYVFVRKEFLDQMEVLVEKEVRVEILVD